MSVCVYGLMCEEVCERMYKEHKGYKDCALGYVCNEHMCVRV